MVFLEFQRASGTRDKDEKQTVHKSHFEYSLMQSVKAHLIQIEVALKFIYAFVWGKYKSYEFSWDEGFYFLGLCFTRNQATGKHTRFNSVIC